MTGWQLDWQTVVYLIYPLHEFYWSRCCKWMILIILLPGLLQINYILNRKHLIQQSFLQYSYTWWMKSMHTVALRSFWHDQEALPPPKSDVWPYFEKLVALKTFQRCVCFCMLVKLNKNWWNVQCIRNF